jgi:AcrR family transcriptional regulator
MARQVDPEQILAGARRALAIHGPHNLTLEEIAEEAGISRVTLYRRGATRESILAELADAAAEEYRRALWPALTGRGSAVERLELALHALCEVAEANLALLVAMESVQSSVFNDQSSEQAAEVRTRQAFTDPLERLIRDGIADGSLREDEPLELAETLFGMVGVTYTHLRGTHRWPPERARAAVVRVALDGVRSDPEH